ncbi:molybdate ABC transporter ATP-binding protein [Pontibacillus halophilus JSM 076056 = DSM 19796]|uniref:Molybdenum transport system permease n=1 Tax=Pontibacillus halophilus JSM 076056 = DSM 19796 TaxID=1385510 RepID=A0A0A5GMX2_9BACI|nr:molybdate ABC transporter permease subunit [Pontibacillus halophilus]KGX92568.1 molybdate ABC transporter ATP-binding protein [Pontibacillus halophilus JSM 076056 = DSM 19796]
MDLFPVWLSLRVATISTIIVFIVGTVLGRLFARGTFVGKTVIRSIFMLPLVLPPTVIGFGLLYLFGREGFIGSLLNEWFGIQIVFTWYAAVLASSVVAFPLMFQSAVTAFQQYDANLERAAYTMGAGKWKVFWTVSFPLAWPGLLAGVILTFARALGEFGATLMIASYTKGLTNTLPLEIFFSVESGNQSQAELFVVMMVVLGFGTVFFLNKWNGSPYNN